MLGSHFLFVGSFLAIDILASNPHVFSSCLSWLDWYAVSIIVLEIWTLILLVTLFGFIITYKGIETHSSGVWSPSMLELAPFQLDTL